MQCIIWHIFCWNSIQHASTKNCWTNLIFGHADSQPNIIYEATINCCFHVIPPPQNPLKKNYPTLRILLKFGMKDFNKSSNSISWIYWIRGKTSLLRVINGLFHMVHNPSTDLQNPIQGTVTDLHVIFSILQEHLINHGTTLILCIKLWSTSFPLLSSRLRLLKCYSEGKLLFEKASEFNYKQFCI
jgi:hypothetical protein